jgi:hypothetical protein
MGGLVHDMFRVYPKIAEKVNKLSNEDLSKLII